MSKRTAWLYIGLPHTGGPCAAASAAAHADLLRQHGIGLPAASPDQMRRASAELLRDHKEQGFRRRDVEGAWAAVCRRAWRDRGSALLGDERLAAADGDQVALLLDGLAGLRTHAVLALRDPSALLVGGWAAEVRQGRTPTLARYAERVLDPEAEHAQGQRWRAAHDVPAILDRWVGALGPERVHVVVVPGDDAHGAALWSHLLGLAGLSGPAAAAPGSAAKGADGTDLAPAHALRAVSAALKGRLPREERRDLLQRWLPATPGPGGGATHAALPADVLAETRALAEKWRARVAESGVDVHGDLDRLLPLTGAAVPEEPGGAPADVLELTTSALGEATLEVSRLRERVAELEDRTATLERKRTRLKRRVARLGG